MKTLFAITLLFGSLASQAATLSSTRAKVDTWLTNNFPAVISKQNAYLAANGRYWQGLLSCSGTNQIPNFTTASDGDAVQDNLSSKPYYEAERISDIFPTFVGLALPAAFQCDQYVGPFGVGYTVTVYVRFNGVIYFRAHTVGPESWRESAWALWQ